MPYDRFVKLQIAADLMPGGEAEKLKELPALGFFGLGAQYYKDNTEITKALADELDERVDTLSRGLLGLTVACARCHDHKFDPVPTLDYYSLAGVFNSSKLTDLPLVPREESERYTRAQQAMQGADKTVKDYLKAEKLRLAEAQADRLADYFLAAWQVKTGKLA